jgi:hypothetical protein
MSHSVFTIVATINADDLPRLDTVLAIIQRNPAGNRLIPFGQLDTLHFASFIIFERETSEPRLVFENNVDGPRGDYLEQLTAIAGPGIDAVYQNCKDYPGPAATRDIQLQYLTAHVCKPHLYHIGTAYRHVSSIKTDSDLRRRLDQRVDALMADALRAQLQTTVPVLRDPPARPRLEKWFAWIAAGVLLWLILKFVWPKQHWIAVLLALLVVAAAKWRIRGDRDERLAALLGASGAARSPASLWRQLQAEVPVTQSREPRAWERVKNWTAMLSPLVPVSIAFRYLWDSQWWLVGIMAVVFGAKMLWLIILVGWPLRDPRLWRAVVFVPTAAALGAFLGLLPWKSALAPWTAVVLVGALLLFGLARLLSARRARETSGNWRILGFVLLAGGVGWGFALVSRNGLHGPWWLAMAAGVVGGVVAFVMLVFASTVRLSPPRPSHLPIGGFVLGGGIFALIFSITSRIPWCAPWLGAVSLAVISLLALFYLWSLPLPTPSLTFKPLSSDQLRFLKEPEDEDVQNHMAALIRIRDDWSARAPLLRFFLFTLNRVFYRTVLPDAWNSTLFGIPTVHFAQWVLLDDRRYIFLSNYDFSWTAYLDDFGARLTTGVQKLWGQGEDNPGITDVGRFKDFARAQMVRHAVWYRAYPGLTAQQIRNNEKIRLGLLGDADEETSLDLLRRLAAFEGS